MNTLKEIFWIPRLEKFTDVKSGSKAKTLKFAGIGGLYGAPKRGKEYLNH